jgi:dUTP pyrophosphatase
VVIAIFIKEYPMQKVEIPTTARKDLLPEYKTIGAVGADLKADLKQTIILKPGQRRLIPTGVRVEIPRGFEAQVRPRSGLAVEHGVTALNSPGTIDSDYRGEIKVILINLGEEDFMVKAGDRIAQLVFAPVVKAHFKTIDQLENSERNDGGFGSTGI